MRYAIVASRDSGPQLRPVLLTACGQDASPPKKFEEESAKCDPVSSVGSEIARRLHLVGTHAHGHDARSGARCGTTRAARAPASVTD